MPATVADRLTNAILYVHGKLYARTDGRIGHRLLGVLSPPNMSTTPP